MTEWNGKKIKELRKRMGLTQSELAKEMNTKRQSVSLWETEQQTPKGMAQKLLSIMEERALYGADKP